MTQASSNENTKNNNKALAKLSPSKVVAEVELDAFGVDHCRGQA